MSENSQSETTPSKNVIVITNNGSLKESLIPELKDNCADLPGLLPRANTPTQVDRNKKSYRTLIKV